MADTSKSIYNTNKTHNLSAQLLTKLNTYIPYTNSALDFESLNLIINDLIINQRKLVVELGSGFSTILIAKVIKLNKLNTKFITVEHDEGWVDVVKDLLKNEGLEDIVTIEHMPLVDGWYNIDFIKNLNGKVDSLIIDGPPAYTEELKHSRMPALYKLNENFSSDLFILLHDINREGEKFIIQQWSKDCNTNFIILDKAAYSLKGRHYNNE